MSDLGGSGKPGAAVAVAKQIEAGGGQSLVIRAGHMDLDAPAAAVERTVRGRGSPDADHVAGSDEICRARGPRPSVNRRRCARI